MAYLDQRSATAARIDLDWLLSDGCVNMWLLTFYSVVSMGASGHLASLWISGEQENMCFHLAYRCVHSR